MSFVNKVILIGHLGADPEVRFFKSGRQYATFSLATTETWKDNQTGEKKSKTEWHNITITNEALVGIAQNFLHKGSKVYIEGQLQTRKWMDSKTGTEKHSTEIVVARFKGELTLLDSKKNSNAEKNNGVDSAQSFQSSYGQQQTLSASSFQPDEPSKPGFYDTESLDDEVPF